MVFSSSLFLVLFLPAFLIPLFLLSREFKNWWILIASLFFYMWGAPIFVFVLLGSVVIDFYLLRWMSKKEGAGRQLLFWLSLLLNLGLLL